MTMRTTHAVVPMLLALLTQGCLDGGDATVDQAPRQERPAPAFGEALGAPAAGGALVRTFNAASNLEASFGAERVELSGPQTRWSVRMGLERVGRVGEMREVETVAPTRRGDTVEYARPGHTEWFTSGPGGLEHGFTVSARPPGAHKALRFEVALEGARARAAGASGRALVLTSGGASMRYEGLKAWDARGVALAAKMTPAPGGFVVEVEDTHARYPVTVDPTFVQGTELIPVDTQPYFEDENFGDTISIDGDRALIATRRDYAAGYAGVVDVMERDGAGSWEKIGTLTVPGAVEDDEFASAVDLSGDTVIVGAPGDSTHGESAGAAYVFERQPDGSWANTATLTSHDATAGDFFGCAVAISGGHAIVGAYGEDKSEVNRFKDGAAYAFTRQSDGSWVQVQKLTSTRLGVDSSFDHFGAELDMDGSYMVVAAPNAGDATFGNEIGEVYFYERAGNGTWIAQNKAISSDNPAYQYFGRSVSIEGERALIGATGSDSAYVFERQPDGQWTEQATFGPGGLLGWSFGVGVWLDGDRALVGDSHETQGADNVGAIYVFERDAGGSWNKTLQHFASDGAHEDRFGASVAMDDGFILAAAPNHAALGDESGAVYTLSHQAGAWQEGPRIVSSKTQPGYANDAFGLGAIAIQGDRALIGARSDGEPEDTGAAYVFARQSSGAWVQIQRLSSPDPGVYDKFGARVVLSGDQAFISSSRDRSFPLDFGAVMAYDVAADGTLALAQTLTASNASGDDTFGVAIAADSNQLAVSSKLGSVYVFERQASSAWTERHRISRPAGASPQFGTSLAIEAGVLMVGDAGVNNSTGAVHVYTRAPGGNSWTPHAVLSASGAAAYQNFGWSLSMDGDTLLVSAHGDASAGQRTGAAYVFTRDAAGDWSEQARLMAPDASSRDNFGANLALDGDEAVLSAHDDDGPRALEMGAAYVFRRQPGGAWAFARKITLSDGGEFDSFGTTVALDAGTALIHTNRNTSRGWSSGSVHGFDISSATFATPDSVTLDEDTSATISPMLNDEIVAGTQIVSTGDPAHGGVAIQGSALVYTPDADFHGEDAFTYTIASGQEVSTARVYVTVTPVNDPPVALDDAMVAFRNSSSMIALRGEDADGDALTYTIVDSPARGSITLESSPRLFRYFTSSSTLGLDSFTFTVSDGTHTSAPATVTVDVQPNGNAPTVADVSVATAEDTPVDVTLQGSDLDGNPLTYTILGTPDPDFGTLTHVSGALYRYTPAPDVTGTTTFTYSASDGENDAPQDATVTVTITPVDDAPTARWDFIRLDQGASASFTLEAEDAEGAPVTFSVVTPPTQGSLSGSGASRTYTPSPGFIGRDSLTFTASDGALTSAPATVTFDVRAVPTAPVAVDGAATVDEDGAVALTLEATDVNQDALTFTVTGQPAHGTLSGAAPNLTYTPSPDFNGADSIAFVANDGVFDSNTATFTFTVRPVNDPPTASDLTAATTSGVGVPITLSGDDPDGDSLTFTVTGQPAHGTLSGAAPNLTYTPGATYSGTDTFAFSVSDGAASATGTVEVTVSAGNLPPEGTPATYSLFEDTNEQFELSGDDPDGDALTFTVTGQPAHGTLSGAAPNLTYTPDRDFNGTDTLTFVADDGVFTSAPATITFTVVPVNDSPSVIPTRHVRDEDTVITFTISATDAEGDALTYTVTEQPSHGTLTGQGATRTYTPDPDFAGVDWIRVSVSDGSRSSSVVITFELEPVNDAPVGASRSLTLDEDTPSALLLPGSDVDNDPITFEITRPPSHGTLSGVAPALTYTPDANYHGPDTLDFRVYDGQLYSVTHTVDVTVRPVNDPPTAADVTVTVLEGASASVTLAGGDVDSTGLSYSIVSSPARGALTGQGRVRTYTPDLGFSGNDTFTYRVRDAALDSNTATVTLRVTDVANPPTAEDQSLRVDEDTRLEITLTGEDLDGDTLLFSVTRQPAHGELTGTAPDLTYVPDLDYHGPDAFGFSVTDGTGDGDSGEVTLEVVAVNDAPVARDVEARTDQDVAVALSLEADDVDSDALTYVIITPPGAGELTGAAPALTYTPNAGFVGVDTFTYLANDGERDGLPATGTITVDRVVVPNLAPVFTDQTPDDGATLTVTRGAALTFTAQAEDPDMGPSPTTITLLGAPAASAFDPTTGVFTWTPGAQDIGVSSLTIEASDGEDVASRTITIEVRARADDGEPGDDDGDNEPGDGGGDGEPGGDEGCATAPPARPTHAPLAWLVMGSLLGLVARARQRSAS